MNAEWRALFGRYPTSSRPTSSLEPLGNAGGLSGARLYRFQSARGPLVARQWPLDGPRRPRLGRIHGWLEKLEDLGFVAGPIPTLDGRTFVEGNGRLWELAPWMPGEADLARPPSSSHLRAMFGGLAAFLTRLSSEALEGPSPGLVRRGSELERLIVGEFAAIRQRLEQIPNDPASSLTRRWLDRAMPLAPTILEATRQAASRPLPLQPCLRDARPDHFLFEGGRLTGLVDFGAMDVDSLAGDLARLLSEAVGPDRSARREALASFEAIRPLEDREARAIETFRTSNAVLGAARWARWRFLEGREFDDPGAVVQGLRRGLERIEEVFDPEHSGSHG